MTAQDRFDTSTTKVKFTPVETPEGNTAYWDVNIYKFLHDALNGTGGFLGKVISYLVADGTENYYNTRKLTSHYINDFGRYITAQYDRVYTDEPPKYESTDPNLIKMIENIDRRGSHINAQKQYALQYGLTDGTVYQASGNDGVVGKLPWIIVYDSLEFQECMSTKDEFNNVTTYVFKVSDIKYHVYTADKFIELEDKDNKQDLEKMVVIKERDMPEQVVRPIYTLPAYGKTVQPFPRLSYDIAKMSLNIFELNSRMVQIMTRQLFDRLVIVGDIDSVPEGVTNALGLAGENASAQLLSPDPNVTKVWKEVIEMYTMIMYEHMRDGGVIISKSSQIPESGASKAFTFQPVESAYKRSIEISERMDAYAVDAYNLWMKKSSTMEVTYNRDYVPVAPITALELRDVLDVAKGLGADSILREVAKKVIDYLGVDKTSDLHNTIMAEIDGLRVGLAE